jgi:alkylhydroperoxidase family enzyme
MAVLRLTEEMTLQIQVPDEVFEPIRANYNDQEVLEVVTTIAAYNMVSRLLNALHVGH